MGLSAPLAKEISGPAIRHDFTAYHKLLQYHSSRIEIIKIVECEC